MSGRSYTVPGTWQACCERAFASRCETIDEASIVRRRAIWRRLRHTGPVLWARNHACSRPARVDDVRRVNVTLPDCAEELRLVGTSLRRSPTDVAVLRREMLLAAAPDQIAPGDPKPEIADHPVPGEQTHAEDRPARRGWDRRPGRRHQTCSGRASRGHPGFLITTVPGVRAQQGYSWWMDGILQNAGLRNGRGALPGANTDSISRPDGLAFRYAWPAVLRVVKRPARAVRAHVGSDGRPDAVPPAVGDRLHLYLYRLGTAGAVTPEPAAPEPAARRDGRRAGRGDGGGGGEGAPTGAGAGRTRSPGRRSIWFTWWRTCCCLPWSLARSHCFGGGRRRHCGGSLAACWCLGSSIAPI